MNIMRHIVRAFLVSVLVLPVVVSAQTYVIPFSEIRQAVDDSSDTPDAAIRIGRQLLPGQKRCLEEEITSRLRAWKLDALA